MAVVVGHSAVEAPAPRPRSFLDLLLDPPQSFPEVVVPFRPHKTIDGEVCVVFSKEELDRSALPFQFSLVLKFLCQRPSLDSIRSFIRMRWGLLKEPIVSSMDKLRNVFVHLTSEEDFVKAFARDNREIDGVPYRIFHWTTEFYEDEEPVHVPV